MGRGDGRVFSFFLMYKKFNLKKREKTKKKFMHTISQSKSIFAIEQKAIVSCFVKDVALLLGHPNLYKRYESYCFSLSLTWKIIYVSSK